MFTKNDYLKALNYFEKETNGEMIKNFDSMKHLVQLPQSLRSNFTHFSTTMDPA